MCKVIGALSLIVLSSTSPAAAQSDRNPSVYASGVDGDASPVAVNAENKIIDFISTFGLLLAGIGGLGFAMRPDAAARPASNRAKVSAGQVKPAE